MCIRDRFLSACGSQKADSNDLANQPATRPEEGAELDPEFSVDDEDTGETAEPQPDAELSEMVDAIYNVQPVDPVSYTHLMPAKVTEE